MFFELKTLFERMCAPSSKYWKCFEKGGWRGFIASMRCLTWEVTSYQDVIDVSKTILIMPIVGYWHQSYFSS